MKKVQLGKTGLLVSEFGFGGIPVTRLDMTEAVDLIRHCLELGINFYDTAHVYADSEEKLGLALEPVREQVYLATKSMMRDAEGIKLELAESLEKLKTDYIDLFQLHNVSKKEELEKVLAPGGALEALEEAREQGKVRVIGLTSHHPDVAMEGCVTGRFSTIQFPFNFIEREAGEKVFAAGASQGMGLIGMKPLGGGLLDRADLCFGFLQKYPQVVPIPGIQAREEVDQIAGFYRNPRDLTEQDWADINGYIDELGQRFCHRCGYCMPCSVDIDIPKVMLFRSQYKRFPPAQVYKFNKDAVPMVEDCIECGECMERCPYDLPIPEMLRENLELYNKVLKTLK